MTDQYRDLHTDAYRQWKAQAADEFVQAQRRAFLDGFESAAAEAKSFRLLREWVEEERDAARERGDMGRYTAMVDVLVKLSEIGCHPAEDGDD